MVPGGEEGKGALVAAVALLATSSTWRAANLTYPELQGIERARVGG